MNTTDIAKEIVRNVSELVSDGKALPRDTVSITNSELHELICLVLNTELPKWRPFVDQIVELKQLRVERCALIGRLTSELTGNEPSEEGYELRRAMAESKVNEFIDVVRTSTPVLGWK